MNDFVQAAVFVVMNVPIAGDIWDATQNATNSATHVVVTDDVSRSVSDAVWIVTSMTDVATRSVIQQTLDEVFDE